MKTEFKQNNQLRTWVWITNLVFLGFNMQAQNNSCGTAKTLVQDTYSTWDSIRAVPGKSASLLCGLDSTYTQAWYQFTASVSGFVRVSVDNRRMFVDGSMDSLRLNDQITIYSGNCGSLTKELERNVMIYGTEGEQVTFSVTANTTYKILVTSSAGDFANPIGYFRIKYQPSTTPPNNPTNDLCQDAIPLIFNGSCIAGSNQNAHLEIPASSAACLQAHDIWYSFKPGNSGDILIRTNADFTPVLTLYTGTCGNLTEWKSYFDVVEWKLNGLDPATTYYLRCAGAFNGIMGNVCMGVSTSGFVPPTIQIVTQQSIQCFGGNEGALAATVSGGQGPFTYLWNNGVTTPANLNLTAGTYFVTVTDGLNNQFTEQITLTQPDVLTAAINAQDVLCPGASNGILQVIGSGGTKPYQYAWPLGVQTDVLGPVAPGVYCATITDAHGCMVQECRTITEPDPVTFSNTITPTTCAMDQYQVVVQVGGGTAPYQYDWGTGNNTPEISLTPGMHLVTVTDQHGCKYIGTVDVQALPVLAGQLILKEPLLCYGDMDAVLQAIPSGGIEPYTYLWSNQSIEALASNLSAGMYQVTITDGMGCSVEKVQEITAPEAIQCIIDLVIPITDIPGEIQIHAVGGTPPYTFEWYNKFGQLLSLEEDIKNIGQPDSFYIIIKDANGCEFASSKIFVEIADAVVNPSWSNAIMIHPNPASDQIFIQWPDIQLLPSSLHILDVTGKVIQIMEGNQLHWEKQILQCNVSNFSPGSYTLEIKGNHYSIRKLFIVVR